MAIIATSLSSTVYGTSAAWCRADSIPRHSRLPTPPGEHRLATRAAAGLLSPNTKCARSGASSHLLSAGREYHANLPRHRKMEFFVHEYMEYTEADALRT